MEIGNAELRAEIEAIDAQIARRERDREEIGKQIRAYQARLNIAPALEQQWQTLVRDREILRTQYTSLQNKKFQAQMTAEMSKTYASYKVLGEPSLPNAPAFPSRIDIAMMGLAAGFFLGLVAAFGREYVDPTLETEEEAARVLQVPVLVSVPEITDGMRRKWKSLPGGREVA